MPLPSCLELTRDFCDAFIWYKWLMGSYTLSPGCLLKFHLFSFQLCGAVMFKSCLKAVIYPWKLFRQWLSDHNTVLLCILGSSCGFYFSSVFGSLSVAALEQACIVSILLIGASSGAPLTITNLVMDTERPPLTTPSK